MRYLKTWAAAVLATTLSVSAAAQTLVVGDQSFNARAVMEAAGVLDDLPYTLEWKQFTAGSPVAEALNVGSLDIGLLGDAPPLFLGALGAPIKVIAVTRQNLGGVAILARKDSSIHSLQDLRGKRAAIWKGSWSQQLLFSALDNAGVPRDSLELRYLQRAGRLARTRWRLGGCDCHLGALCHPAGAPGRAGAGDRRRADPGAELRGRQCQGSRQQAGADQRFSPTDEKGP